MKLWLLIVYNLYLLTKWCKNIATSWCTNFRFIAINWNFISIFSLHSDRYLGAPLNFLSNGGKYFKVGVCSKVKGSYFSVPLKFWGAMGATDPNFFQMEDPPCDTSFKRALERKLFAYAGNQHFKPFQNGAQLKDKKTENWHQLPVDRFAWKPALGGILIREKRIWRWSLKNRYFQNIDRLKFKLTVWHLSFWLVYLLEIWRVWVFWHEENESKVRFLKKPIFDPFERFSTAILKKSVFLTILKISKPISVCTSLYLSWLVDLLANRTLLPWLNFSSLVATSPNYLCFRIKRDISLHIGTKCDGLGRNGQIWMYCVSKRWSGINQVTTG